jgi:hypothetical protein
MSLQCKGCPSKSLLLAMLCGGAGCMAGGEHAASGSPGTSASVGFATSALAVGEHTILSTPGYDFTENASGVFRHGTDGWETVVVSNINAGGRGMTTDATATRTPCAATTTSTGTRWGWTRRWPSTGTGRTTSTS